MKFNKEKFISKIKDPRIYICLIIFILMFFKWVKCDINSKTENFEAEYQAQALFGDILGGGDIYDETKEVHTYIGFEVLQLSATGLITIIIPFLILFYESFDFKFKFMDKVNSAKVYIIGSIIGLIGLAISSYEIKDWYESQNIDLGVVANSTETKMQIVYYIEIVLFAALIISTIIFEYVLKKKTVVINTGVNSSVSNIDYSNKVSKITTVGNVNLCPKCGTEILEGKKFCKKCGTKIEINNDLNERIKPVESSMTVREYIEKNNDFKCSKCGCTVDGKTKFCPECGEKVIFKIRANKCDACGSDCDKDNKFCPNCGEVIKEKVLITNCKTCGKELIFGKSFCTECGSKVD